MDTRRSATKSRNKIKLAIRHVNFNAGSKNHSLVFVEGLVWELL